MVERRWHERDFIEEVAARRGCEMTRRRGGGPWDLRAVTAGVPWTCRVDPLGDEIPTSVRWECPGLKLGATRRQPMNLVIGWTGGPGDGSTTVTLGHSSTSNDSLGTDLVAGLALAGAAALFQRWRRHRAAPPEQAEQAVPEPVGPLGPAWHVIDNTGVADLSLLAWLDGWPPAWFGDGDVRPVTGCSVVLTQHGLRVETERWWSSAPALDRQIDLGLEVARRLVAAGA